MVIPVLGDAIHTCRCKESQWHDMAFKIIRANQKPFLSGETCLSQRLVMINSILTVDTEDMDSLLREFKDVFERLHNLGGEYHININKAVSSIQHTPHRTLVARKERLRQKIQLESKEIITKVEKPTAWISSFVALVKPGKLGVCIDTKDLNKLFNNSSIKYQP